MTNNRYFASAKAILLMLLAFLILAFAQPDWSPVACIVASSFGYALFWKGVLHFKRKKVRFLTATLWFALITLVHLNWFMADRYVGSYIYVFLLLICSAIGAQFGSLTLLVGDPKKMKNLHILALCAIWTLFEWGRLHVLSGFSWDPVGLAMSGTLVGAQMASLAGVYGLTFWVLLTNFFALKYLSQPKWAPLLLWGAAAAFPYCFGGAQIMLHATKMANSPNPPLSALLVQTALLPEEKVSLQGSRPLSPLSQWERILNFLAPYASTPHDLIVLPEGAVPYGTHTLIYPSEAVFTIFKTYFQGHEWPQFPLKEKLSNRFWAQTLAERMQADLILGLEDADLKAARAYNAAFLFSQTGSEHQRYEKRVLVPMGEYIPFMWCKKILSKYGIADSFTPGERAKVFSLCRCLAGISICYEETYGHLIRSARKEGAELLINLTNDVWYPRSRLPVVHFYHGRLRAIETGLPLLRACNTGVTCGVDALGRVVDSLPYENAKQRAEPGVLSLQLSLYSYKTLYSLYGDFLIVYSSLFFLTLFLIILLSKRGNLILKYLNICLLQKK